MYYVPDEGLLPLLLLVAEGRCLLPGLLLEGGPLYSLHGADHVRLGHDGLGVQRLVLVQRAQALTYVKLFNQSLGERYLIP